MEFAISDTSPVYPYRQLAGQLREKIESGEIEQRLPSYTELIADSGLTLGTVQRAVKILKDEGLVYGVPGRGLFVREGTS